MNTALRRADERGHAEHGWLDSRHSFSFASYRDPRHMGFSDLRVINEDHIAPGAGFPTHPHSNMEIFTYVLSGAVAHEDSMGNKGVIRAGELQYMSAGSGVTHSECNASEVDPLHLYQIWLLPEEKDLPPQYAQLSLREETEVNTLRRIAHSSQTTEKESSGSFPIRQDATIYVGDMDPAGTLSFRAESDRAVWLQVLEGEIEVNETLLAAGDAIGIADPETLDVAATQKSLFLLFDLRDTKE